MAMAVATDLATNPRKTPSLRGRFFVPASEDDRYGLLFLKCQLGQGLSGALPEGLLALGCIDALQPDRDLLIRARITATGGQCVASEMPAMRQRRAPTKHSLSLLDKKKARKAG